MSKKIDHDGAVKSRSQFQEAMDRLVRNKLAMAGLAVLVVVIGLCLLAPVLYPEGYDVQVIADRFQGPSWEHPAGTDQLGRDIFCRLLYGGRNSLKISILATALGSFIGIVLGAIAGYYGGQVDNIIMRVLDVFNSIPNLLMAIAISAALGAGTFNCILAVGITGIPSYARTVRAPILAAKNQEYVEAAHVINASDARIIFKHVLPNVLSPIIVRVSQGLAGAILVAASLSFLGLGVQPPAPEWGSLLSQSRQYITKYPYLVYFPGLAIASVVLAMNLFGDGLRDALDPRLKR